ncbi:C-GCAxxG-C-C family protein [Sulfurospirillum arcachonense]|uniref:C-GCAxxG-C-C family protein n=1 Tax=Sulfurospirillum arcachonense TaxID=57666 RepID=UPI000469E2AB|nr:C-GCAxxG-C-C family protein [Sulfurospirillum arcachonense]
MNKIASEASNYFFDGFLCSESVVKAIAEENNISSSMITKIATAFGRGLANSESTCGALSGGILALSMIQGRDNNNDSFELLYENIAELKKSFVDEFKEDTCTKLLGFSLNDADANEKFTQNDCKNCKCSKYVAFVTQNVSKMLKNQ